MTCLEIDVGPDSLMEAGVSLFCRTLTFLRSWRPVCRGWAVPIAQLVHAIIRRIRFFYFPKTVNRVILRNHFAPTDEHILP